MHLTVHLLEHASMHFTVYFPMHTSMHFHCLLFLCMPRMHSLSTSPVHAYAFHCLLCAYIYAFHSVLALRMPLCISLPTFPEQCTSLPTSPVHASMHFTVYFPCACIYAFHLVLASMHLTVHFPEHASMHIHCVLSLCS